MAGISIGVIGGGASAVCLIDALAQAKGGPGTVTVFEPSPRLWRGRAYQVDSECIKVNATADDMSVRAGDPGHFERWLDGRERLIGDGHAPDSFSGVRFAPRTVYGEYLEQTAYAALAELRRRGWRVDIIGAAVTTARRTAGQVLLGTEHGDADAFDYVVLCVGGDGPKDVYGLSGAPGFIADPYPVAQVLPAVDPDDHVAVIGSGLTAVDTVLSLVAQEHRGPISLLSRRGALPGVRQRPLPFEPRHLTPERMRELGRRKPRIALRELVEIVGREAREAGADLDALYEEITGLDREAPVERLRRQFAAVDSSDPGLRVLQRAVPDIGPDVWPLLGERDRTRILHSHYRTVMSLCCPMPPDSAARLLALVDAGRLEIRAGLRTVEQHPGGGFDAVVTDGTVLHAQTVVNAVGATGDRIPARALSLVTALTGDRAVSPHPHGGLHVERATSRFVTDGVPDPRLYGLGTIAAGTLFFTFGVPSLVDRSVDIVDAILRHAETGNTARPQGALLPAQP
ncbi:FAD/NAD(P)-binding protein [Streptomyces sp. cmx-4-7]|uniref:FAD/NAD(P)-binding protein n=1 Tax=Streptomyces sp. cmx-4-7 TaxID=2790939 RepID=UPI003980301D